MPVRASYVNVTVKTQNSFSCAMRPCETQGVSLQHYKCTAKNPICDDKSPHQVTIIPSGHSSLCFLHAPLLRASLVLLVPAVRVVRTLSDPSTVKVEDERYRTAGQANKREERAGPLVVQPVVHLVREQHHSRPPKRTDECLRRQCRRSLVLVRVYEIVVCRVVEEDESKAHREAAQSWPRPVQVGIARPCEDEKPDGDEPAADHHGYETRFSWGLSVVLGH